MTAEHTIAHFYTTGDSTRYARDIFEDRDPSLLDDEDCYEINSMCECLACEEDHDALSSDCLSFSRLKCPLCQELTSHPGVIDSSVGVDYKPTFFYTCMTCKTVQLLCGWCDNKRLCRITRHYSHHPPPRKETDAWYMHPDDVAANARSAKKLDEEGNRYPNGYYGNGGTILQENPPLYHDAKKFGYMTGDDGGATCTWKCDHCDIEFEILDK